MTDIAIYIQHKTATRCRIRMPRAKALGNEGKTGGECVKPM